MQRPTSTERRSRSVSPLSVHQLNRAETEQLPLSASAKDENELVNGGDPVETKDVPVSKMIAKREERRISFKSAKAVVHLFNDWWLLESSAMLVSIGAMAAIIGLLLKYQNRPLEEWPYRVTINALVSFLNTLAKGAVLLVSAQAISQLKWMWFHQSKTWALYDVQIFDDASRGPLGALQLLFRAPRMSLATLSAFIILFTFAMDPFTQQILSFPQEPKPGGQAIVSGIQHYAGNPVTYYKADGTLDIESPEALPEPSMLKAIYAGIFRDPTSLAYQCPSGNCTWPAFSSLSICTQCTNGTGHRVLNGSTMMYISPSNLTWSFDFPNSPDTFNVGAFIANLDSSVNSSIAGIKFPLAGFARFPQVMFSPDARFQDLNVSGDAPVDECAFFFCVQNYQVSLNQGGLSVQATSPWHNESGLVDFIGVGPSATSGTAYLTPPNGHDRNGTSSTYSFNPVPLLKYFRNQLNAHSTNTGTDLLSQLSLADDVPFMVTNIGLSMSATMMSSGDLEQNGIGFETIVFIHVRWPWLILPAVLVVWAALLLLLVIMKSAGNRMMIWKSSSLALAFHSSELFEGDLATINRVSEMEERAKEVQTRMVSRNGDWQFVRG